MRIFHYAFPFLGGAERLALYLAEALNEFKVYSLGTIFDTVGNIKIEGPKEYSLSHIYYTIKAFLRKEEGPLISSGLPLRAMNVKGLHIHYVHEPYRWLYDLSPHLGRKYRVLDFFYKTVDKYLWSRPNFFISNSEITAKNLKKWLGIHSVILHPPVKLEQYYRKSKGDYFLYLGHSGHTKRLSIAINAFKKQKNKLIVAGRISKEYQKGIHYMLNVKCLGWVDEEKKRELLAGARALVFPSYEEPFGITAIEALASDTPLLVAEDGGYPTLLVKRSGLIEKRPEGDIYKAGIICRDWKKCISLVSEYQWKDLRRFAKPYDFNEFRKKARNIINDLLEENT